MDLSSKIKRKASEIGFSKIGIAKAEFHLEDEFNINRWIENGHHASMGWIERRKEERSNIKKYYPNSKSIISVAMNYFTGNSQDYFSTHKISNYAWGEDYHIVIKNKLYELLKLSLIHI